MDNEMLSALLAVSYNTWNTLCIVICIHYWTPQGTIGIMKPLGYFKISTIKLLVDSLSIRQMKKKKNSLRPREKKNIHIFFFFLAF